MQHKLFIAALGAAFLATQAQGAGFEKSVFWSGKEAGYASSGQSRVSGSQSIYFNPAGLAGGSEQGDVSVNYSPTSVKLEGNISSVGRKEETDHNFSNVGGLTVAYKINERFGIGAGAYAVGGSKAIYDNVDLTGNAAAVRSFTPAILTNFAVREYGFGAAYEVMPGLRIGAVWRILRVQGNLATIKKTVTDTAFVYVNLRGLEDTNYSGFRLGVQYDDPNGKWGAGFRFRNRVKVAASSTGGINYGQVVTVANATFGGNVGDASVGTVFPAEFSLGGHVKTNDKFVLMGALDYAKYGSNNQLGINASITSAALGANPVVLPNIPLNWKDQWNFRLGGEYTGIEWVKLRAGYSLTTRVTSEADARATIAPAGKGHVLTAGAGTSVMGNKLDLDGALEHSFNKGTGSMSQTAAGATTKELLAGVSTETKANVWALHLGATYKF